MLKVMMLVAINKRFEEEIHRLLCSLLNEL